MRKLIFSLLGLATALAHATENEIKLTAEQFDHLGIQVEPLQASANVPLFYAAAKVQVPPDQEFIVSANQSGLLQRLHVGIGETVRKGQVLATLSSPQLVALQTQFLKSQSEEALAHSAYSRDQKLLEDGIIPKRRLQETQTVYQGKQLETNEAKQLLMIAGMSSGEISDLGKSHKLRQQHPIIAPIDGMVLERIATTGQRLDELAPIFRIANVSQLWLDIQVPQEQIAHVNIGDRVQIENTDITAKVTVIGQSVNADNQTVPVRAVINGNKGALKVGQSVNCQLVHASRQAVFKVPNTALIQREGHTYLFVRNPTGFAVQEISVQGKQDQDSVISGELTGSEQVAVKGTAALKASWEGIGGGDE